MPRLVAVGAAMAVITAVLLFAWNQETPDVARKTSEPGPPRALHRMVSTRRMRL